MNYKDISDEEILILSLDFIKHEQPIPEEIRARLRELGMDDIMNPLGDFDD